MIALLLAAAIGQLPIQPPIIFDENSKADVATIGYLAELEHVQENVRRLQRAIDREPNEQRWEVLRARLDQYRRDMLPILDGIRRSVERLRAKERPPGEFAA